MQDTAHYLASMIYNWLLRLIVRTQIQDNLGGYWATRTELVRKLPMDRIFFVIVLPWITPLHFFQ